MVQTRKQKSNDDQEAITTQGASSEASRDARATPATPVKPAKPAKRGRPKKKPSAKASTKASTAEASAAANQAAAQEAPPTTSTSAEAPDAPANLEASAAADQAATVETHTAASASVVHDVQSKKTEETESQSTNPKGKAAVSLAGSKIADRIEEDAPPPYGTDGTIVPQRVSQTTEPTVQEPSGSESQLPPIPPVVEAANYPKISDTDHILDPTAPASSKDATTPDKWRAVRVTSMPGQENAPDQQDEDYSTADSPNPAAVTSKLSQDPSVSVPARQFTPLNKPVPKQTPQAVPEQQPRPAAKKKQQKLLSAVPEASGSAVNEDLNPADIPQYEQVPPLKTKNGSRMPPDAKPIGTAKEPYLLKGGRAPFHKPNILKKDIEKQFQHPDKYDDFHRSKTLLQDDNEQQLTARQYISAAGLKQIIQLQRGDLRNFAFNDQGKRHRCIKQSHIRRGDAILLAPDDFVGMGSDLNLDDSEILRNQIVAIPENVEELYYPPGNSTFRGMEAVVPLINFPVNRNGKKFDALEFVFADPFTAEKLPCCYYNYEDARVFQLLNFSYIVGNEKKYPGSLKDSGILGKSQRSLYVGFTDDDDVDPNREPGGRPAVIDSFYGGVFLVAAGHVVGCGEDFAADFSYSAKSDSYKNKQSLQQNWVMAACRNVRPQSGQKTIPCLNQLWPFAFNVKSHTKISQKALEASYLQAIEGYKARHPAATDPQQSETPQIMPHVQDYPSFEELQAVTHEDFSRDAAVKRTNKPQNHGDSGTAAEPIEAKASASQDKADPGKKDTNKEQNADHKPHQESKRVRFDTSQDILVHANPKDARVTSLVESAVRKNWGPQETYGADLLCGARAVAQSLTLHRVLHGEIGVSWEEVDARIKQAAHPGAVEAIQAAFRTSQDSSDSENAESGTAELTVNQFYNVEQLQGGLESYGDYALVVVRGDYPGPVKPAMRIGGGKTPILIYHQSSHYESVGPKGRKRFNHPDKQTMQAYWSRVMKLDRPPAKEVAAPVQLTAKERLEANVIAKKADVARRKQEAEELEREKGRKERRQAQAGAHQGEMEAAIRKTGNENLGSQQNESMVTPSKNSQDEEQQKSQQNASAMTARNDQERDEQPHMQQRKQPDLQQAAATKLVDSNETQEQQRSQQVAPATATSRDQQGKKQELVQQSNSITSSNNKQAAAQDSQSGERGQHQEQGGSLNPIQIDDDASSDDENNTEKNQGPHAQRDNRNASATQKIKQEMLEEQQIEQQPNIQAAPAAQDSRDATPQDSQGSSTSHHWGRVPTLWVHSDLARTMANYRQHVRREFGHDYQTPIPSYYDVSSATKFLHNYNQDARDFIKREIVIFKCITQQLRNLSGHLTQGFEAVEEHARLIVDHIDGVEETNKEFDRAAQITRLQPTKKPRYVRPSADDLWTQITLKAKKKIISSVTRLPLSHRTEVAQAIMKAATQLLEQQDRHTMPWDVNILAGFLRSKLKETYPVLDEHFDDEIQGFSQALGHKTFYQAGEEARILSASVQEPVRCMSDADILSSVIPGYQDGVSHNTQDYHDKPQEPVHPGGAHRTEQQIREPSFLSPRTPVLYRDEYRSPQVRAAQAEPNDSNHHTMYGTASQIRSGQYGYNSCYAAPHGAPYGAHDVHNDARRSPRYIYAAPSSFPYPAAPNFEHPARPSLAYPEPSSFSYAAPPNYPPPDYPPPNYWPPVAPPVVPSDPRMYWREGPPAKRAWPEEIMERRQRRRY